MFQSRCSYWMVFKHLIFFNVLSCNVLRRSTAVIFNVSCCHGYEYILLSLDKVVKKGDSKKIQSVFSSCVGFNIQALQQPGVI